MVYMVHLTNQMTKRSTIPNMDDIMRQNPDIARQLASAAMQQQTQQMRGSAQPAQPTSQASPNNPLSGLMSFMQGSIPPSPPPTMIPRAPQDSKPIQIGIPKRSAMKAPAPAPAPTPKPVQMRPPPSIDDLLKDIKQSVIPPAGNGPPPPEKIKRGSGKAGSTGKNSVVIKL
jgi:hypothetical protein